VIFEVFLASDIAEFSFFPYLFCMGVRGNIRYYEGWKCSLEMKMSHVHHVCVQFHILRQIFNVWKQKYFCRRHAQCFWNSDGYFFLARRSVLLLAGFVSGPNYYQSNERVRKCPKTKKMKKIRSLILLGRKLKASQKLKISPKWYFIWDYGK
jgi:hypothetical protein